jgi:DNA-directed RNA polymerase subunit RPC12/RpoP
MTETSQFCDDCGKEYNNIKTLQKHKNENHLVREIKCPDCGEIFFIKKKMYNHRATHKSNEVTCNDCGETVKKGSLSKHKKKKHVEGGIDDPDFKCNQCPYMSKNKFHLKRHEDYYCGKTLNKNKVNHMCNVCNKTFPMKKHLDSHKLSHVDKEEIQVICKVCDKSFSRQNNLMNHMKSLHGITERNNIIENVLGFAKFETTHLKKDSKDNVIKIVSNNKVILECDKCNYKTDRKFNLRKHIHNIHELQLKQGRKRKADDEISIASKYRRAAESNENLKPTLSKEQLNDYVHESPSSFRTTYKNLIFF